MDFIETFRICSGDYLGPIARHRKISSLPSGRILVDLNFQTFYKVGPFLGTPPPPTTERYVEELYTIVYTPVIYPFRKIFVCQGISQDCASAKDEGSIYSALLFNMEGCNRCKQTLELKRRTL